jgi:oligoribonuclease NrnB/cAMP/cGMP phosphodiesterase (DHH superfamily)
MKTTVIHHSADFDGIFCREIARKFLPADTEFIGWDYGDAKVPFPSEGTVYVLDLSPECFTEPVQPDQLLRFIWIDHHKSAIEKFANIEVPGYRIDGVAACRLAWQWFTEVAEVGAYAPNFAARGQRQSLPQKQDFIDRLVGEPLAVRLAGEYDIWDKRDPDAETFQFGLRSQELSPEHWDALLHPSMDFVTVLLGKGKALQRYQQANDASVIQSIGFELEWEGLKFLACNAARYNSLLFTAGLQPHHDACFGFKWTGKDWSVSLYHAPGKEHHDLSQIAVKHGGGGHRGACGFRTKSLPFLT